MNKVFGFLKKEPMLIVSVIAALLSFLITPPTIELFKSVDYKTLIILLMMLTVLEGFKKENIFRPLLRFSGKITSMAGISFFLVFSVFVTSMFVTNDVSLIIFVPLTILIFRAGDKEKFILPVISMENIAAVRGSLLTPFGSPQNLFIFGQSGMKAYDFIKMMFPLCIISAVLLCLFIILLYRKNIKEKIEIFNSELSDEWLPDRRKFRILYSILFLIVVFIIVSRTEYWIYFSAFVILTLIFFDRRVIRKTDYVLLATFFCFFIFSSAVSSNEKIGLFLSRVVNGNEYISSIVLSQFISNVPASIVLYPFSSNIKALLYGLDSAGLVSLIGSLASVINYRIYVREYPGNGLKFIKVFTLISLAFFAFVSIPGYFLSI